MDGVSWSTTRAQESFSRSRTAADTLSRLASFIARVDTKPHTQNQKQQQPPPSHLLPSYVCQECGKSFPYTTDLLHHQELKHTLPKPHQCPSCGQEFSLRSSLQLHKCTEDSDLCEHGESRLGSPCPACTTRTSDPGRLQDQSPHRQPHLDGSPYACAPCGRGFSQKQALLHHQQAGCSEPPSPSAEAGSLPDDSPAVSEGDSTQSDSSDAPGPSSRPGLQRHKQSSHRQSSHTEERLQRHKHSSLTDERLQRHKQSSLTEERLQRHKQSSHAEERLQRHKQSSLTEERLQRHKQSSHTEERLQRHKQSSLTDERLQRHKHSSLTDERLQRHKQSSLAEEQLQRQNTKAEGRAVSRAGSRDHTKMPKSRKKLLSCRSCDMVFRSTSKLLLHRKEKHSRENNVLRDPWPVIRRLRRKGSYPCQVCSKVFVHHLSLRAHYRQHSASCSSSGSSRPAGGATKDSEPSEQEPNPVRTSTAEHKTVKAGPGRPRKVVRLESKTDDAGRSKEVPAEEEEEEEEEQEEQEEEEEEEQEKEFPCPSCAEVFSVQSQLREHVELHQSSVKRRHCSLCTTEMDTCKWPGSRRQRLYHCVPCQQGFAALDSFLEHCQKHLHVRVEQDRITEASRA